MRINDRPEMTCNAIIGWCRCPATESVSSNQVRPRSNAFVESSDGKRREERLPIEVFGALLKPTAWPRISERGTTPSRPTPHLATEDRLDLRWMGMTSRPNSHRLWFTERRRVRVATAVRWPRENNRLGTCEKSINLESLHRLGGFDARELHDCSQCHAPRCWTPRKRVA